MYHEVLVPPRRRGNLLLGEAANCNNNSKRTADPPLTDGESLAPQKTTEKPNKSLMVMVMAVKEVLEEGDPPMRTSRLSQERGTTETVAAMGRGEAAPKVLLRLLLKNPALVRTAVHCEQHLVVDPRLLNHFWVVLVVVVVQDEEEAPPTTMVPVGKIPRKGINVAAAEVPVDTAAVWSESPSPGCSKMVPRAEVNVRVAPVVVIARTELPPLRPIVKLPRSFHF